MAAGGPLSPLLSNLVLDVSRSSRGGPSCSAISVGGAANPDYATLAIKDLPYPFGWRRNGQYSNHNNYDVVRILRLGWPHMTPAEIDQARTEIREMLKWALSESMSSDGQFRDDLGFSDSDGEAYYYGVSF